jgi:neutral trehalase
MSPFNAAKDSAKKLASKTKRLLKLPSGNELTDVDVAVAREYIQNYWKNLERHHPNDDESLLGLPKPYLVPSFDENASFDYDELYYWDSYFMVQGMLQGEPANQELVDGILENLMSLFQRFKVIPNASRTYLMGRSAVWLATSRCGPDWPATNKPRRWSKRFAVLRTRVE